MSPFVERIKVSKTSPELISHFQSLLVLEVEELKGELSDLPLLRELII